MVKKISKIHLHFLHNLCLKISSYFSPNFFQNIKFYLSFRIQSMNKFGRLGFKNLRSKTRLRRFDKKKISRYVNIYPEFGNALNHFWGHLDFGCMHAWNLKCCPSVMPIYRLIILWGANIGLLCTLYLEPYWRSTNSRTLHTI